MYMYYFYSFGPWAKTLLKLVLLYTSLHLFMIPLLTCVIKGMKRSSFMKSVLSHKCVLNLLSNAS